MPDYVSILKRSIAARNATAPADRRQVFDKARGALARQLAGVEPPLSDVEIEAEHQKLEDAIDDVEAEYAFEDELLPGEDDADTEPGIAAHETRAAAIPAGAIEMRAAPAAAASALQPDEAPVRRGRAALEPADAGVERAPAMDEPFEPAETPPASRRAAVLEREDEDDGGQSRAPLLVLVGLLLLVAAGIAAAAWSQWGTIESMIADVSGEEADVVPVLDPSGPGDAQVAAGEGAASADGKSDERLIGGEPAALGEGEQEVAAVAPDAETGAEPAEPDAAPTETATPETAPEDAEPTTPREVAALPQPVAPAAPDGGIVAQRAIFYEQGAEGAPGKAEQGTVSWKRTETADGRPAIQATVEVPERDATATVTISRNADAALPASHLIEVSFSDPAKFGGGIERVPALVVKPDEGARGEPLVGAAVPVTEGMFWIALSDEAEQTKRNVALLAEGEWFDVPLLFKDGKRALLTFEKGVPGDQLFETVIAAWQQ